MPEVTATRKKMLKRPRRRLLLEEDEEEEQQHTQPKPRRRRKLLVGSRVEVGSVAEGFLGSWHSGTVTAYHHLRRVVEYDHHYYVDDDQFSEKPQQSISVSPLLEGILLPKCSSYRGIIRPIPPPPPCSSSALTFGLCVDAFFEEAWWEGVIFRYDDEVELLDEQLVFFPDMGGDRRVMKTDELRVTQDWEEVEERWIVRGKWKFIELLIEKFPNVVDSAVHIWDQLREKEAFKSSIKEWTCNVKSKWVDLVHETVSQYLAKGNKLKIKLKPKQRKENADTNSNIAIPAPEVVEVEQPERNQVAEQQLVVDFVAIPPILDVSTVQEVSDQDWQTSEPCTMERALHVEYVQNLPSTESGDAENCALAVYRGKPAGEETHKTTLQDESEQNLRNCEPHIAKKCLLDDKPQDYQCIRNAHVDAPAEDNSEQLTSPIDRTRSCEDVFDEARTVTSNSQELKRKRIEASSSSTDRRIELLENPDCDEIHTWLVEDLNRLGIVDGMPIVVLSMSEWLQWLDTQPEPESVFCEDGNSRLMSDDLRGVRQVVEASELESNIISFDFSEELDVEGWF